MGGVLRGAQRFENGTHDAVDLLQDLVVPESQHAITARLEKGGALLIDGRLAVPRRVRCRQPR